MSSLSIRPSRLALILCLLTYGGALLALGLSALAIAPRVALVMLVLSHALEQLRLGQGRPVALRPGSECWIVQGRESVIRYLPPRPLFICACLVVLEFSSTQPRVRRRLILFPDSLNAHDDWQLRRVLRDLQRLQIRREAVSG